MNKREKLVLVFMPFLAAGLLAVWAPNLLKVGSLISVRHIKPFKKDGELEKINAFMKDAQLNSRSAKSKFAAWGNDPFYTAKIDLAEVEEWPLKGIFWRENNPSALIGDEIVEVGDKLGDFVVTNILPDTVVISDGRMVIKLTVGKGFPKP